MDKTKYQTYLQSDHWRAVRKAALEYAEHRCQLCYSMNNLEVHHRTYERVGNERPADVIALCKACHEKHHDRHTRNRVVLSSRRTLRPDEAPSTDVYPCLVCGKGPFYRKQGAVMVCTECFDEYRPKRKEMLRQQELAAAD